VRAVALHITTTRIFSDKPACRAVAEQRDGRWWVTGYPGPLDHDQAVTAMTIAEVYATNPPPDHRIWAHVAAWQRQLGLPHGGGE